MVSDDASQRPLRAVADDLACGLDPAHFAQSLGFDPDPWQRDVLRSQARQALLNCSRQSGKSSTVAAVALHRAVFRPGSLVLMLSPSLRQSAELFRKTAGLYGRTGGTVPSTSETKLTLELANGSRIVSLPGKEETIRGYSAVDLLLVDEAARVEDGLIAACRPMLAVSQGRLVALSTPWGRRGWFAHAWHDGGPTWERTLVPATEVPRINPAWLAAERKGIGDFWFRQEYLCEFMDNETQAFASIDIAAAISEGVEQWEL